MRLTSIRTFPRRIFYSVALASIVSVAGLAQQRLPVPQSIPAPGPATDHPYAPQAILPGGVVVPLYAPGSTFLKTDRVKEPEVYNMAKGVPGRIQSIVNIHNPSIEFHAADPDHRSVVILVAGGGHDAQRRLGGRRLRQVLLTTTASTQSSANRLRRDGELKTMP